eukprot:TRINITY_DN15008_c0_g1_i1.p1 TRINITY_DN15008_c0_g1~~TRINITY_DN15008_c0_g1_i1.p1  ORF type:complete len:107 (-),score=14.09 TRINITY_DN15008_c0_g1_i1:9-329(-)
MLFLILLFFYKCLTTEVAVVTTCGSVLGVVSSNNDYIEYLGIPYAVPPLGEKRWKRSELITGNLCWNGTYQALSYKSQCPQFDLVYNYIDGNEGDDTLTGGVHTFK